MTRRERLRAEAKQALDILTDKLRHLGHSCLVPQQVNLVDDTTIFLPQSRIDSMNPRSLSVNGRSARGDEQD
jgi:hypothetical protein